MALHDATKLEARVATAATKHKEKSDRKSLKHLKRAQRKLARINATQKHIESRQKKTSD